MQVRTGQEKQLAKLSESCHLPGLTLQKQPHELCQSPWKVTGRSKSHLSCWACPRYMAAQGPEQPGLVSPTQRCPHNPTTTAAPQLLMRKFEVKLNHPLAPQYVTRTRLPTRGWQQPVLRCGKGWHFPPASLRKPGSPFHKPASGCLSPGHLPAVVTVYRPSQGVTQTAEGTGDAEPHHAGCTQKGLFCLQ